MNQAFLHLTKLDSGKVQGLDEQAFEEVLRALCREPLSFSGFEGLRRGRFGLQGPRPLLEMAGPGGRVLELRLKSSESAFVSQVLYIRDITRVRRKSTA